MNSITTRWGKEMYALIFSHNIKASKINAICKKHGHAEDNSTKVDEATVADIKLLIEAIETIQPKCIPEHQKSGLDLLHNLAYAPSGKRRRTKAGEEFDDHCLTVLSRATEIALTRLQLEYLQYGRCVAYPIFEVRSPHHGKFSYYYRAWQSGGGFEIVGH